MLENLIKLICSHFSDFHVHFFKNILNILFRRISMAVPCAHINNAEEFKTLITSEFVKRVFLKISKIYFLDFFKDEK